MLFSTFIKNISVNRLSFQSIKFSCCNHITSTLFTFSNEFSKISQSHLHLRPSTYIYTYVVRNWRAHKHIYILGNIFMPVANSLLKCCPLTYICTCVWVSRYVHVKHCWHRLPQQVKKFRVVYACGDHSSYGGGGVGGDPFVLCTMIGEQTV